MQRSQVRAEVKLAGYTSGPKVLLTLIVLRMLCERSLRFRMCQVMVVPITGGSFGKTSAPLAAISGNEGSS